MNFNKLFEVTADYVRTFGKHNVSLVLQGHDHYREDLTYDNVRYTVLGAISDKSEPAEYLKMKVDSDGISFDWILFK